MAEEPKNIDPLAHWETLPFNTLGIEGMFKEILESSANLSRIMEPQIKAMEPLFSAIADQANAFAAITEAIKIPSLVLPPALSDSILAAVKDLERFQIEKEQPVIYYHHAKADPIPQQHSEERIAKLVTEMLLAKIDDQKKIEKALTPTKEPAAILPPSAQWKNLDIKFKDGFSVAIYYGGKFVRNCTHEELGFIRKNTKDHDPDKQWEFLHQLAVAYKNLDITTPTLEMLAQEMRITKGVCAQRKRALSEQLRAAFNIDDDPFFKHGKEEGYRAKFKLEPEAVLRDDGEVYRVKNRPDMKDKDFADPDDKEWDSELERETEKKIFG